nr:hypothetical protein [Tanacetum cinerariifolium]
MAKFIKELRDNTFSGLYHEDANEHIEKILEIVNLFHVPNITKDQIMLRVFPMFLTGVTGCWLRNKPSSSIKTWEDLKTKFLSKYCPPARTAKKMDEINNFQQEPDETLYQSWERFKELLMKQILDSKGAIPTKTAIDAKVAILEMAEYSQKEIKKVNEKVYAAQVKCEQCKGPHYTKDWQFKEECKTLEEAYYTQFGAPSNKDGNIEQQLRDSTKETMKILHFIILDMPEDVKVPLILGRSFLSTAHAKIDVFKKKITFRVGDEKNIFKSMKPASSLIKRVYITYERNQVDDLMPTIEEGKVIDEPMIDIIKTRNYESFDEYPSFCDFGWKIHIVCAYNLRFSCMIVDNIDGYRDQAMGDVIVGEPFCKASCVEARRFVEIITIHNGNDNVTYQMTRSHLRFKHLSNVECNKIKLLLK